MVPSVGLLSSKRAGDTRAQAAPGPRKLGGLHAGAGRRDCVSPSMEQKTAAFITNDAAVLGLLAATLGFVFWSSSRTEGFWRKFYTYVPALLLCYLIPALFNSFGWIDGSTS